MYRKENKTHELSPMAEMAEKSYKMYIVPLNIPTLLLLTSLVLKFEQIRYTTC